jgi:hypothetical protein
MRLNRWSGLAWGGGVCALTAGLAYGIHWFAWAGSTRTTSTISSVPDLSAAARNLTQEARPQSDPRHTDARDEANTSLPESDRQYIWEIERVALALDVHTFPRMAKAIRESDAAGLALFLSNEFVARVPDLAKQAVVEYPFGQFGSVNEADEAWTDVNRSGFVAFLLEQAQRFPLPRSQSAAADAPAPTEFLARDPRVEIRLMRLWPVDRAAPDGLWQGTLKIRYAGRRSNGQPGELELSARFSFHGPADAIARRQNWLESCRVYSSRLREADELLMKEAAAERGLDPQRFYDNWQHPEAEPMIAEGGVYLCDYNRDDHLDALVVDRNAVVLFHGTGDGTFQDATQTAGLAGAVKAVAAPAVFVDLDEDAYEDLLLADQVFRNNRDGTFSDVTALTNLRLPSDASTFAVTDYDRDGRVDLYVLRASPGPMGKSRVSWVDDQTGPGNQLWRNMGNWRFRNVTAATNTSAGHRSCFAAAWLDANSDGLPDVAVSDEFGSSVLLLNHPDGRFTEHPVKQPFGGFCMGIAAGDLDNDGHIDLYLSNMASKAGDRIISNLPPDAYTPEIRAKVQQFVTGNELLRNTGDGVFQPLAGRLGVTGPGWSYGANMVDLNNDGWLDIYAPGGFISYSRGEPDG